MAWIHLTLKPVMSHFGGTKFNNKQPREREDLVLIIAFAWQHAPWCSKDNSWEEDGGKKSYLLPCVPDSLCILHRYDTQCPAKHGGTAKSGLAKCKTGWHPRWHMTVFSALSLCCFVLRGRLHLPLPAAKTEPAVKIVRCLCTKSLFKQCRKCI